MPIIKTEIDLNREGYRNPEDRLERMFVLIGLLKYKRRKTLRELAGVLEKSERQVRRDIKTLERFYDIDYDHYNRPFIFAGQFEDELAIEVTAEEAALLSSLVKNSRHKLSQGLRAKLDKKVFFKEEITDHLAERVDLIEQAINDKTQVKLKAYQSASRQVPRDMVVEPIALTALKYLAAYDVIGRKNKIFALERITQGIEILDNPFQYREEHRHLAPDIFGMATGAELEVKLLLSTRAYLLMREEFPRSIPYLKPQPEDQQFPYVFEARLYGVEGVGRFVMGLPGQVKVVQPQEIHDYIQSFYPAKGESISKIAES